MKTDYMREILEIADRYAKAGEDWEQNLFAGYPEPIDWDGAKQIASWLENEADREWGYDPRHKQIATGIRNIKAARAALAAARV